MCNAYAHLGSHVGASDVCMDCRNELADFGSGWQLCAACHTARLVTAIESLARVATDAGLAGTCAYCGDHESGPNSQECNACADYHAEQCAMAQQDFAEDMAEVEWERSY